MAVDKEGVFEAAEALITKGVKPTMENVREELGGGSFATISPLLREWRETQGGKAAAVVELPDDVKAAVERSGRLLWEEACKVATKRVLAAEERLNEVEMARQKEEKQFEAEIGKLEGQIAGKDGEITTLNSTISSKCEVVRNLEVEVAKLTAQAETASLFQSQFKAVNDRLEKMESEQRKKTPKAKSGTKK